MSQYLCPPHLPQCTAALAPGYGPWSALCPALAADVAKTVMLMFTQLAVEDDAQTFSVPVRVIGLDTAIEILQHTLSVLEAWGCPIL